MFARLRRLGARIAESLFYLPALGVAAAAFLAFFVTWADRARADTIAEIPLLMRTTVDGARAVLTTAAAATITVAGIVLSVTVVAVQLAASQFSPRVVVTIFGSRFQQVVIAIVTGAFTYDLLVLSTIHSASVLEGEPTRTLSVTLALVLAVVSVMAIIAFIDHSVGVMQVGEIIRRTSDATLAVLRRHLPERGTAPGTDDQVRLPPAPATTIRSTLDGWIQHVDTEALLEALPPGSVARLDVDTGWFVGVGSPLATVWMNHEDADDLVEDRVCRAVGIGRSRSTQSDPTYGVRQLVDVALRALSPGINDPTTANEVILHLTEILREVLVRDMPPRVIHGAGGRRLFRPHQWTRGDWVGHAFQEVRIASTDQPEVARALIRSMGSLLEHLEHVGLAGRAEILPKEAALVLAGIESNGSLLEEDTAPIRDLAVALRLAPTEEH
ncbi:MAG: DUF2254 domain-containing protein [Acidimicrobiia bacterium]|nr:MAG: DUF2254 domain-containing protein [Acidimicrobiia bacterium]